MDIELKKWNETDFAAIGDIFTRCDRTYLSDGLPLPYTAAHAEAWYESRVKERDGSLGLYRIIHICGRPAGVVTVECSEAGGDAELSYLLLEEFKGRGAMTLAVEMICPQAFDRLNIRRICAQVYHPNLASRRVLEKNGFVLTGSAPEVLIRDGKKYRLLQYEKLR